MRADYSHKPNLADKLALNNQAIEVRQVRPGQAMAQEYQVQESYQSHQPQEQRPLLQDCP
ncbi:hypothetical protein D5Y30_06450 [Salmonella enterica subsp. enterica serovar Oranienburg]|nr:hypothetical protein [Salmonella enterica subsp. enterica serovar Oranienburg]